MEKTTPKQIEKLKETLPRTVKILIGLTLTLLTGVAILLFKYCTLTTKVESLNNQIVRFANCETKTIEDLKHQQFKEDSYIRQQERDTTLILFIFSVLIASFGFFTFKLSSDEFAFFKDKVKDDINNQHTKYETVHNQLVETQTDFYSQIADYNEEKAKKYKSEHNELLYITYIMKALNNHTTCYLNHIILNQNNVARAILYQVNYTLF